MRCTGLGFVCKAADDARHVEAGMPLGVSNGSGKPAKRASSQQKYLQGRATEVSARQSEKGPNKFDIASLPKLGSIPHPEDTTHTQKGSAPDSEVGAETAPL